MTPPYVRARASYINRSVDLSAEVRADRVALKGEESEESDARGGRCELALRTQDGRSPLTPAATTFPFLRSPDCTPPAGRTLDHLMAEWSGVRGKRVLMTGGTNGIGLAAARELAARGADLSIVARDQARGEAAAAQIGAAGGGRPVDVLLADLSSQASVRQLAAEILERYPRL